MVLSRVAAASMLLRSALELEIAIDDDIIVSLLVLIIQLECGHGSVRPGSYYFQHPVYSAVSPISIPICAHVHSPIARYLKNRSKVKSPPSSR